MSQNFYNIKLVLMKYDNYMDISPKYVNKYSYLMAKEQVMEMYESQGYEVKAEYPVSKDMRADLYAYKDDMRIIIDLKSSKPSETEIKRIKALAQEEGMSYVFYVYSVSEAKVMQYEEK